MLGVVVVDGQAVVNAVDVGVVDHEVGKYLLLLGVIKYLLDESLKVLCQVFVLSERSLNFV